ncbi:MAG: DUF166 family protein [Methanoregulaceae archaeon]
MKVCIVSDGRLGERAFDECRTRFSTEYIVVESSGDPFADDVSIEVPWADLYLSYLRSPDRALALVQRGTPVILGVSFGPGFVRQAKQFNPDVVAPRTMCSLEPTSWCEPINAFARALGRPVFSIEVRGGRIHHIEVLRGAPCGSTAPAAAELVGRPLTQETLRRFGLRIEHHCRAPRLGRTCDKETAALVHVRELLRALPPGAIDAETAAFCAECERLYDERTGGTSLWDRHRGTGEPPNR